MAPQPPVELHVTLGNAGIPKYPASHRPVQMLLTGLVGEQLKLPLAGLGGGKWHTTGSSSKSSSVEPGLRYTTSQGLMLLVKRHVRQDDIMHKGHVAGSSTAARNVAGCRQGLR